MFGWLPIHWMVIVPLPPLQVIVDSHETSSQPLSSTIDHYQPWYPLISTMSTLNVSNSHLHRRWFLLPPFLCLWSINSSPIGFTKSNVAIPNLYWSSIVIPHYPSSTSIEHPWLVDDQPKRWVVVDQASGWWTVNGTTKRRWPCHQSPAIISHHYSSSIVNNHQDPPIINDRLTIINDHQSSTTTITINHY